MARTPRIMMNRKYTFAMLWNWNHKFLGTKLMAVYFAVRILFREYVALGCPSSSLSSAGSGILKNTRLLLSCSSLPVSEPLSGASLSLPVVFVVPEDSRFFSVEVVRLWRRCMSEARFLSPLVPPALCVAHRILFTGFETSLSSWVGSKAIALAGRLAGEAARRAPQMLPCRRRRPDRLLRRKRCQFAR